MLIIYDQLMMSSGFSGVLPYYTAVNVIISAQLGKYNMMYLFFCMLLTDKSYKNNTLPVKNNKWI